MNYLNSKRILITGVCGTIGKKLLEVLTTGPDSQGLEIIGIDNIESEIFFLDQKYIDFANVHLFIGDIRDIDNVRRHMQGIDYVFHLAALKHVVICERSPYDAVQTNIQGLQNIIIAANEARVGKVLFTSSDKAVNPTNVMGTSKLMGERLVTAANSSGHGSGCIFASTRFGNVLGSNGSVVPIFHRQIASGGPVTLTDSSMTRFIMSIENAVNLVIDSAEIAQGGEVFVTKMPVVKIKDLATTMIEELAPKYDFSPASIEIKEIGIKPGEKMFEELMSGEETRRALELEKFFAITPAFRGMYDDIPYDYQDLISQQVDNPYISSEESPLYIDAIKDFLLNTGLLDTDSFSPNQPAKRYWPGDKEEG